MSDTIPHFELGLTADGDPVVMLDVAGSEAPDMATLLRLAPEIALPAHAHDTAVVVNHFAHGSDYEVITDIPEYRRRYERRLASEDPTALYAQGVHRLRDFGIPDFGQITPPKKRRRDVGILCRRSQSRRPVSRDGRDACGSPPVYPGAAHAPAAVAAR